MMDADSRLDSVVFLNLMTENSFWNAAIFKWGEGMGLPWEFTNVTSCRDSNLDEMNLWDLLKVHKQCICWAAWLWNSRILMRWQAQGTIQCYSGLNVVGEKATISQTLNESIVCFTSHWWVTSLECIQNWYIKMCQYHHKISSSAHPK